jgi:hypothetical protein
VEPRVGKVVNGAIVLDDGEDLVEGAAVTVWIGDHDEPVNASEDELRMVREGQRAVERGDTLDARAFLDQLRRG